MSRFFAFFLAVVVIVEQPVWAAPTAFDAFSAMGAYRKIYSDRESLEFVDQVLSEAALVGLMVTKSDGEVTMTFASGEVVSVVNVDHATSLINGQRFTLNPNQRAIESVLQVQQILESTLAPKTSYLNFLRQMVISDAHAHPAAGWTAVVALASAIGFLGYSAYNYFTAPTLIEKVNAAVQGCQQSKEAGIQVYATLKEVRYEPAVLKDDETCAAWASREGYKRPGFTKPFAERFCEASLVIEKCVAPEVPKDAVDTAIPVLDATQIRVEPEKP